MLSSDILITIVAEKRFMLQTTGFIVEVSISKEKVKIKPLL